MVSISGQQKLKVAKLRTEIALRSFNSFLKLVTTLDEATKRKAKWPTDLEYLTVLADELQYSTSKVLWIPKSRRMMATWTITAYVLWQVLREDNYLGLVQSQTEQHAKDWMRDRLRFMYNNLPRWFRFLVCQNNPEWTTLDVRFPERDSRVRVFPQGSSQWRQYTPSFILLDEAAHQKELGETLTAVIPFLEKDTQVVLISSVAPGQFSDIVFGEKANRPEELFPSHMDLPPDRRKGMSKWDLKHGGTVLMVHYSCDPNKNSAWLEQMDREVAGGINGPKWRQEFEIESDAFSGQRVYPHFDRTRHVKEFEFPDGAALYLAADYGVANPTAVLQCGETGYNEYGPTYGVRKMLYLTGLSIDDLKRAILMHFGPASDYRREWIDPSTDAVREVDTRTHFWLFNNGPNARRFQKAKNSAAGRIIIGEWLHQNRLVIHPDCEPLIHELETYRLQQWASDAQERKHDQKEKVVKKDDHAADALKYLANGVRLREHPVHEEDEKEDFMQDLLEALEIDNPLMIEQDFNGW